MALSQIRSFNFRVAPSIEPVDATATKDRIYVLGLRTTDNAVANIYSLDWNGNEQATEHVALTSSDDAGVPMGIAYRDGVLCVVKQKVGIHTSNFAHLQYVTINLDRTLTLGPTVQLLPDVAIDVESIEIVGGSLYITEGTGFPVNLVRYDWPDLFRVETKFLINTPAYYGGFTHGGEDNFWIVLQTTTEYPTDATLWQYDFDGPQLIGEPHRIGQKTVGCIAVGGTGQMAVLEERTGLDIPVTIWDPVESYERPREARNIMVPGEQVGKIFKPRAEFGIYSRDVGSTMPTLTLQLSPDGIHWDDHPTTLTGHDYKTYKIASGFYCRLSVANMTNAVYWVHAGYVGTLALDISEDIIVREA